MSRLLLVDLVVVLLVEIHLEAFTGSSVDDDKIRTLVLRKVLIHHDEVVPENGTHVILILSKRIAGLDTVKLVDSHDTLR